MKKDEATGYLQASEHYSLTGFTGEQKALFIQLYQETGNLSACAKAVGVARITVYKHLEHDEKFKADFDDAIHAIKDEFEATMVANGKKPNGFMDRMGYVVWFSL